MKTELSIYLNYRRALAQAHSLDEAAAVIRNQISNLEGCCSDIANVWEGPDSGAYISKVRTLIGYLEKAEKNTSIAAGTVRSIAEKTYKAEKTALQIALTRTYR